MNRYRKAMDCMEQIVPRKRVCNFGLVRCECAAAMECPSKREVVRLQALLLTASYKVPVMHDKGEFALLLRAAGRGEGEDSK